MSWIQKLKRNWKGGGVGVFLAVGLGLMFLLLSHLRLGEGLIHLSYNVLFRLRGKIPIREVVMVYMDDISHKDLNQPYDHPWDRALYARLLDRLTSEHAKGVAFDIVFSTTNMDHVEGDQQFARAIKQNGHVMMGAEFEPLPGGDTTVTRAIDAFYDAAGDDGWGFVQLEPDQDFIARRHLHVPNLATGDSYSSITWKFAQMAGAKFTADPQDRYRERWMNYYGPPGTIPSASFEYALETNSECPAKFFSNRWVFVGSSIKTVYSGQRKDELRTPFTYDGFCPAVDVQATQFLNLIREDWLTRPSRKLEIVMITFAGILFGFGLSLCRPLTAMGLAVVGALAVTFIAKTLFEHERVWFPWLIIVAAQIPVALLWSVVFNSVQLYVQNRLYEQSLSMYLSPKLVKKFAGTKDLLKVGAQKQMLTILFSDIANFTSISEGMEGDSLAHEMNKYFQSAVSNCIHATDGTIVKYIGDAIFAFWNAPDSQIDHAMRGCEAALRFCDQPPQYVNGRLLVTRIGLHTGEANVGNFGSTARVDYTAIGENINLASRMEGLNKFLGTEVLITETVHEGLGGRLLTRSLGKFQLKGFERAVGVYELAGQLDKTEGLRPLHEAFAEALKLFQKKDLAGAEAAFRRVLEKYPKDGPAGFYVRFIAELRERPLPDDWNGEVELKEK